ncbi:hypothetical protein [Methylobacterium mesophilicum]|uniref:hypothetical protein n=1 Tax=Methylobacterium mesophilicum TaxID=39956 RepID=UPI002F359700
MGAAARRPPAPGRGRALVLGVLACVAPVAVARAEPGIRILDLPFKVRALRGSRSEAAVSVATSGLLPITGGTAGAVPLPAPAETGIVVLGEGATARLLVGLADGRVAVVAPDGGRP